MGVSGYDSEGSGYGFGGSGYGGSGYGYGGYGYGGSSDGRGDDSYGGSGGFSSSGYGGGFGSGGFGYGDDSDAYYTAALDAGVLTARVVMAERNQELRRRLIQAMGPDRFFRGLGGRVVHEDVDGCGNPRRLIRVVSRDAVAGYFQAVHVVDPTSGADYYLGVSPDVCTCQAAVASTFGLSAEDYQPERES